MKRSSDCRPDRSPSRSLRSAWLPALAGIAAYAAYRRQPLRFDLIPRVLPNPHPWIDPAGEQLFRPETRVAVVTAHPDDTEFYIGGLLIRLGEAGARLRLIVTTDGEKGFLPFVDADGLRRTRREEQRRAARDWNAAEVVFLGYPDGRLRLSEPVIARIASELRRLRPDYILTFDGDYPPRFSHQDHRVSGKAASLAARRAGVGAWALHFSTRAPNFAVDVTAPWQRRLELLPFHGSQWHGNRMRMVRDLITRDAVLAGNLMHVPYAESFRCERLVRP